MTLTEMQTLILWALLARPGGASFQKNILPEVTKSDREALVKAGLITSERRGGSGFWLEITDNGWAWARDHLDADLPKRSIAGSAVLQAWLKQLKAFMDAHDFTLADILASQQPPKPTVFDYDVVQRRIRKAYLEVTGNRLNTRALLSDLREKLRDIDRNTLDDALKRMQQEQQASLYQLDNRAEITEADRAAAIYIGQEPRHILWIER
jgi:hypothetical protein